MLYKFLLPSTTPSLKIIARYDVLRDLTRQLRFSNLKVSCLFALALAELLQNFAVACEFYCYSVRSSKQMRMNGNESKSPFLIGLAGGTASGIQEIYGFALCLVS